jgi:tRNA (Thr-GGU) A37 N-methylase
MVKMTEMGSYTPIGFVHSPYTETNAIPKGPGAQHDAEGVIEIRPSLEAGLTDIEGFSHLYVIWVFDRSEDFDLMAQPPTADRPHGVFSTRSFVPQHHCRRKSWDCATAAKSAKAWPRILSYST